MRLLALLALLPAGCIDFRQAQRDDDPLGREGAPTFRVSIDRFSFPAGDGEAMKLLESLRPVPAPSAGGSSLGPNGIATWGLSKDWPALVSKECATRSSWALAREVTRVRAREVYRLPVLERLDPLREGRVRFFAQDQEIGALAVSAAGTRLRLTLSAQDKLVSVLVVPAVVDRDGGEQPFDALACPFTLEPGRFQLFTANRTQAESAGAALFVRPGVTPRQVALAIAVELDPPAALK